MSIEAERKFLVKDPTILISASYCSYTIRQYYIDDKMRVRIKEHSDGTKKAYITIKHPEKGMARDEWKFEIDADYGKYYYHELKNVNKLGSVEKTRYLVDDPDSCREFSEWEIDVFHGDNEGLILAEIELPRWADMETNFKKMKCLGKEVTEDERYYNSYLAKHPYSEWRNK